MNRLFGKGSKEPAPTLDDASGHIQARSDTVDARVDKIDAELMKLKPLIQRTRGVAQQRYKQRAIQLMQQKRQYLGQQDMMMQQQFNVDQLQFTTQTMKDTQVQVKAMKDANKSLKKDMKKLNIDKVDQLQDDLADLYMDTQEVQEIMGRAYDVPDYIDDEELLGELDAMDFNMEGDMGLDYLNDAMPTSGTKLPELPGGNNGPISQPADQNPQALEAQLGL